MHKPALFAMQMMLIALLSGCAAQKSIRTSSIAPSSTAAVTQIDSAVVYVGPGNVPLDRTRYPTDIAIAFPLIKGGIFGQPEDAAMYAAQVDDTGVVHLDLASEQDKVDNTVTSMDELWQRAGLKIEPEETEFGRLGTFPYNLQDGSLLGGGGFIDAKSRNTLILIYVDRACYVSGEVTMGLIHYSHELFFTRSGFHWIELEKQSHTRRLLKNHDGRDVLFSIHVEDIEVI